MEDTLLFDAVERFLNKEMAAQELFYFEEMRKNNPEFDQQVVEMIYFIQELNKFGTQKNLKHILIETENKLSEEGVISRDPSIKIQKKFDDIRKLSHLQIELIKAAIDYLSIGSFLNSELFITLE